MPTYEAAPELTRYKGHPVIETPLNSKMQPDVRRLAAEADKAGGGLIYIVNPNNPDVHHHHQRRHGLAGSESSQEHLRVGGRSLPALRHIARSSPVRFAS
jgi:hypothetical protein